MEWSDLVITLTFTSSPFPLVVAFLASVFQLIHTCIHQRFREGSGSWFTSSVSLLCPLLQFLLLLGCFALFWSLYYTLEVTLAHLDLRGLLCLRRRRGGHRVRRGHQRRGVEEPLLEEEDGGEEERDSGVELHAVLDSEAKMNLLKGERLAT